MIHCLGCGEPLADDAPFYPDVNGGGLGACCAPTYADLLGEDSAFVDLHTLEPLPLAERRAIYDAHIAAGGKPTDTMARV